MARGIKRLLPPAQRDVGRDVAAALPPWIAARLIVGASVVAARVYTSRFRPVPEPVARHASEALLGWDAERYLEIARFGYAALPRIELRFFPLVPLLVRAVDAVLPGRAGFALFVVANASALVLGALLHRVALYETRDGDLARRAVWIGSMTPAAFVFVWGYSESLWAALALAALYLARRRRWWWAAALAAAVGLARPVGVLIVLPLAIEAFRQMRGRRRVDIGALAAVVAAPVGTALYLAWVWREFGDPLLPYTIQQSSAFRGELVNPFTALRDPVQALLAGEMSISSMRVGWAAVLILLAAVSWRRWPASYAAFGSCLLLVALCTSRLGSFERYGFTAFPIVLAVASITDRPWAERLALCVGAAAMGLYGLLALLGPYTP